MPDKSIKTCAECGGDAAVFVSFVKGGKVKTTAWCAPHAQAVGLLDPHAYALLDRSELVVLHRGENSPRCAVCDCSQRDFERHGRFGCAACYGAFAGLLPPLVKRMHRGAEHRGKIPLRGADSAVVRHRLALLQEQLNDAVRNESFEGAAQTRDAIAALKAKLLAPAALSARRENTAPAASREQSPGSVPSTPNSTPHA